MTKGDKINLLHFITRTGMYINPVDDKTIVSFIHGYKLGTKNNCDFIQLLKQQLTEKYLVDYSSDGWPGQISRLAKSLSLSWVTTFKIITLEIIADEQNGGLEKAMIKTLKTRIESLIEEINTQRNSLFNNSWIDQWLCLCSIKNKWFKQLWNKNEWAIITSIDKQVKAGIKEIGHKSRKILN